MPASEAVNDVADDASFDEFDPEKEGGTTEDVPVTPTEARAPAPPPPEVEVRFTARPTVQLDPKDMRPSWPVAIATLERLGDWSVLALRLGTLALIQSCVRELAQPDASADHVVRLRELTDALAKMPFG